MSLDSMSAVVARDWPRVARLLGAEFPAEWRDDSWFWLPRWLAVAERDPTAIEWGPRLVLRPNEDGSRTVLGEVGFHGRPDGDGVAEFGYTTVRAHRRRGHAEEAVRTLLTWAGTQPGVRTFRATVDPDNGPSIALLGKLGFTCTGRQRHPERGAELIFERGVDRHSPAGAGYRATGGAGSRCPSSGPTTSSAGSGGE
jgi:ribosomal-protein-alanine N-acetyltransferase